MADSNLVSVGALSSDAIHTLITGQTKVVCKVDSRTTQHGLGTVTEGALQCNLINLQGANITGLGSGCYGLALTAGGTNGIFIADDGSTVKGLWAWNGQTNWEQITGTDGKVLTANKLLNARSLKTALGSTTAVTFDGSADQNSIPVSGTLPVANGGTGNTIGAVSNLNFSTLSNATDFANWTNTAVSGDPIRVARLDASTGFHSSLPAGTYMVFGRQTGGNVKYWMYWAFRFEVTSGASWNPAKGLYLGGFKDAGPIGAAECASIVWKDVSDDITKVPLAGGTMTGLLTLSGAPTADLHAATKKYVDDNISTHNTSTSAHQDIRNRVEEVAAMAAGANHTVGSLHFLADTLASRDSIPVSEITDMFFCGCNETESTYYWDATLSTPAWVALPSSWAKLNSVVRNVAAMDAIPSPSDGQTCGVLSNSTVWKYDLAITSWVPGTQPVDEVGDQYIIGSYWGAWNGSVYAGNATAILTKTASDWALQVNASNPLPTGGAAGASLRKISTADGDAGWFSDFYSAKEFFVDASGPTSGDGTIRNPLKTVTAALALCSDSVSDVITLLPGEWSNESLSFNKNNNLIRGIAASQSAKTKIDGEIAISANHFGMRDLSFNGMFEVTGANIYIENVDFAGDSLVVEAGYVYFRNCNIASNQVIVAGTGTTQFEGCSFENTTLQFTGGGYLVTKNCSNMCLDATSSTGGHFDLGGCNFITQGTSSYALRYGPSVGMAYIVDGTTGTQNGFLKAISVQANVYYLGTLQYDHANSVFGTGTRLPGGINSLQLTDSFSRVGYSRSGTTLKDHLDGISAKLASLASDAIWLGVFDNYQTEGSPGNTTVPTNVSYWTASGINPKTSDYVEVLHDETHSYNRSIYIIADISTAPGSEGDITWQLAGAAEVTPSLFLGLVDNKATPQAEGNSILPLDPDSIHGVVEPGMWMTVLHDETLGDYGENYIDYYIAFIDGSTGEIQWQPKMTSAYNGGTGNTAPDQGMVLIGTGSGAMEQRVYQGNYQYRWLCRWGNSSMSYGWYLRSVNPIKGDQDYRVHVEEDGSGGVWDLTMNPYFPDQNNVGFNYGIITRWNGKGKQSSGNAYWQLAFSYARTDTDGNPWFYLYIIPRAYDLDGRMVQASVQIPVLRSANYNDPGLRDGIQFRYPNQSNGETTPSNIIKIGDGFCDENTDTGGVAYPVVAAKAFIRVTGEIETNVLASGDQTGSLYVYEYGGDLGNFSAITPSYDTTTKLTTWVSESFTTQFSIVTTQSGLTAQTISSMDGTKVLSFIYPEPTPYPILYARLLESAGHVFTTTISIKGDSTNGVHVWKNQGTSGGGTWTEISGDYDSGVTTYEDTVDADSEGSQYSVNMVIVTTDSANPGLVQDGSKLLAILPPERSAEDDTKVPLAGGTMTGLLTLSGAPTADLHASTKKYVDDNISALHQLGGFIGTFATIAALPARATTNDWVIVTNDAVPAHNGLPTMYVNSSTDPASASWQWALTYGTDISGKMDLITSPTTDNLVSMTATGNSKNSGKKISDLVLTTDIIALSKGGTGVNLSSAPSMLTNLGTTTAATIFATSPRPGVTGTLPVANGGTGLTSVTSRKLLKGNGTSALTQTFDTTYKTIVLRSGSRYVGIPFDSWRFFHIEVRTNNGGWFEASGRRNSTTNNFLEVQGLHNGVTTGAACGIGLDSTRLWIDSGATGDSSIVHYFAGYHTSDTTGAAAGTDNNPDVEQLTLRDAPPDGVTFLSQTDSIFKNIVSPTIPGYTYTQNQESTGIAIVANPPGGQRASAVNIGAYGAGGQVTVQHADPDFSTGSSDRVVIKGELVDYMATVVSSLLYPVGSVIFKADGTDPADLLGGTWVKLGSGVLKIGDTANTSVTGSNTIARANLPNVSITSGSQSVSHTHTTDISHTHSIAATAWADYSFTQKPVTSSDRSGATGTLSVALGTTNKTSGNQSASHTHTVSLNGGVTQTAFDPAGVTLVAWRRTA